MGNALEFWGVDLGLMRYLVSSCIIFEICMDFFGRGVCLGMLVEEFLFSSRWPGSAGSNWLRSAKNFRASLQICLKPIRISYVSMTDSLS